MTQVRWDEDQIHTHTQSENAEGKDSLVDLALALLDIFFA